MKYRKGKTKSKAVKSKKTAIKKALVSNENKKIRAVVKRVLGSQAEKKVSSTFGSLIPITVQVGVTSLAQNAYCLTPGSANFSNVGCNIIAKGLNNGDRVGDEIQVKNIYFNYQINCRPYNATSNNNPTPKVIVMYFISPKVGQQANIQENAYVTNLTTANFFDADFSTECGLAGDMGDMMKRIDTDNYRLVAKREHKVFYAGLITDKPGTVNATYNYNNNDFNFMVRDRVKLEGMKVAYNVSNGNPQIQPVYCLIQVLNADGSIPPTSQQTVDFRFVNEIYYTDI